MKGRISLTLLAICLLLVPGVAFGQAGGDGSIKGKVVAQGDESMSGGQVKLWDVKGGYSPLGHEYWQVQGYAFPIADDGSFSGQLPEGSYYLIAIKKPGESQAGPPQKGDLVYPSADAAKSPVYTVKAGQTTDIGTISGAVPLKEAWVLKGKTGVEGTVVDASGEKPFQGALVLANIAGVPPAAMRPLFTSDGRTGKDGRYIIRFPKGGQYLLMVLGRNSEPVKVTVKTGDMTKGIDIRLTR
ncbi:MAG: carboxypeptidase-like regulatory domain-containing protein [Nitrospiraceae bacterium]|nr:carboxypeptidase-like regulatory domain-containing protein [Nitrospiraceae bacterium]